MAADGGAARPEAVALAGGPWAWPTGVGVGPQATSAANSAAVGARRQGCALKTIDGWWRETRASAKRISDRRDPAAARPQYQRQHHASRAADAGVGEEAAVDPAHRPVGVAVDELHVVQRQGAGAGQQPELGRRQRVVVADGAQDDGV